MVLPLSLALLAAFCASSGVEASPAPFRARYAMLPMRNLAREMEAVTTIQGLLQGTLEARGASFVSSAELEDVLRSRRIRYTESVGVDAARGIRDSTGADFILVGTVFALEREPLPRVSVALRVIDATTGRRVQSSVVTLRGDDFEGLLGLGRIEDPDELLREAQARILDMFDTRGAPHAEPTGRDPGARRVPSSSLSLFVHEEFDPAAVESVGVLPLSNRTRHVGVGLVFSEILAHECFRRAGIQAIEQSELRSALVRQRIRSVEGLGLDVLRAIGQDLGTRYFVLGSVDRYREETFVRGERFPEIEAFVRILDVQEGRVVASVGVHRTGLDYEGLLGLGDVKDPVALAARVASEMVAAVGIER